MSILIKNIWSNIQRILSTTAVPTYGTCRKFTVHVPVIWSEYLDLFLSRFNHAKRLLVYFKACNLWFICTAGLHAVVFEGSLLHNSWDYITSFSVRERPQSIYRRHKVFLLGGVVVVLLFFFLVPVDFATAGIQESCHQLLERTHTYHAFTM